MPTFSVEFEEGETPADHLQITIYISLNKRGLEK